MKRNKLFLLSGGIMLAALSMTSCGNSGSDSDDVKYVPVQQTEGGAWVFVNDKGEKIGTQQWEFEPSVTIGNYFTAKNEDGLTVYRWKGEEAEPVDSLAGLMSAGICSEGLIPVTPPMSRIQIVNGKGEKQFELEPIDGKEIVSCAGQFQEGFLIVTNSEWKSGVIDKKGNVIVKPQFGEISNFSGGYALAVSFDPNVEGPVYSVIDKDGKITPVSGKFGYDEDECGTTYKFENGVAYVPGEWNYENFKTITAKISTDGSVEYLDNVSWVTSLADGAHIIAKNKDDVYTGIWEDAEGKVIMQADGDSRLYGSGKWVVRSQYESNPQQEQNTLYDDKGQEVYQWQGSSYIVPVGGNFSPICVTYDFNAEATRYALFVKDGKSMKPVSFYGIGSRKILSLDSGQYEEVCETDRVFSAYVDVTAAASKMASYASGSVKGKDAYYIGQPASQLFNGNNYYSYTNKISIPTVGDAFNLAEGAGFSIYGYAIPKNGLNSPIKSFEFRLTTLLPSGKALKEAIVRHLKNQGYTVVSSGDNYEELKNYSYVVVVYGSSNSQGIGMIVQSGDTFNMTPAQMSKLAAEM